MLFTTFTTHTYMDALIQSVHCKNEFGAFCDIVDRHEVLKGKKNVYIGDRGYCSYNNMAHVMEHDQFFLFRTKDIHSKKVPVNPDTYELTFRRMWIQYRIMPVIAISGIKIRQFIPPPKEDRGILAELC